MFGVRARCTPTAAWQRRAALGAGLLAGFALGYRPDLILALALAHGWLLWRSPARGRWPALLAPAWPSG